MIHICVTAVFIRQKGGIRLKFKLFSAVLLLVCFLFLGVLSGVIPVTELTEDVTAGLFPRIAEPSPVLTGTVEPAGTDAPASTPAPTPAPTGTPPADESSREAVALPEARVAPTKPPFTIPPVTFPPTPTAQAASASPGPTPTAAPSPAPTPEPEPTPALTEAPVSEAAEQDLWEPTAEVISTTITWNDPIQNSTDYTVDGTALLDKAPDISLSEKGYQVLIIHTHGTEAFTPSGEDRYAATSEYRTIDPDHSILKVGQALGDALASYGLRVLVDTGLYDWPDYDDAYSRSGEAIQTYLEENPTIQVVIDLHRDAIGDDDAVYRTVSDQFPDAAQMMFVVGTDATLSHPDWRENLAFAMSLQGLLEEEYPHLMRPTLLSTNRYNQQLTPASVLLEIGTAGNTLEDALTSAKLFADVAGPALAARIGA